MSATANRTDTTYTFGVITPEELDRLSEATSQGSFQQWSGQVRLAKIRGHEAECVGVCDASGNLVTGCVILYLNGRFGADGSVYFGPIGISDDPGSAAGHNRGDSRISPSPPCCFRSMLA